MNHLVSIFPLYLKKMIILVLHVIQISNCIYSTGKKCDYIFFLNLHFFLNPGLTLALQAEGFNGQQDAARFKISNESGTRE